MTSDLHLLRPYWLLAILPLALLLLALWRDRQAGSVWSRLIDAHLLPHLLVGQDGSRRRLPLVLLGVGWLLAVLALAGPVWERLPQPLFNAVTARIVLLDLSPSMNAADLTPSRLARARFEIQDLLRAADEGQVGLIAFGPEPFLVSPLTGDAKTILAQVPQLTTDLIPVPGQRRTHLALRMAGDMLRQSGSQAGDIILVTDGVGDTAAALEAAHQLAAAGHRLSVLAVGTADGAPIPLAAGGFVKDQQGAVQLARLDAAPLRQLAQTGNGRYLEAQVGDADTRAMIALGGMNGGAVAKTELLADQWREEGPWLLLAILPLAALGFRRGWLLPLLALGVTLAPDRTWAFGWSDLWQRPDQQALRQLQSGEGAAAAERFTDPAWRAAARYRAGDHAQALEALSGLAGAEVDYNRGNALAHLGRLQEAADAYERALHADQNLSDARDNLDLVRKLIEQQQNQEQQKQSEQQQEPPEKQPESSGGESGSQDQKPGQDQGGGSGEGGADQGDAGSETQPDAPRPSPVESAPDRTGADPRTAQQDGREDEEGEGRRVGASDAPAGQDSAQESAGARSAELSPEERERQQAMDAQLARVPDDPAGLLRQRFLLQHLRREGRLP